ncbi:phosphatase PAP2 family protein [Methylocystis sp. IM3]|uniref:phosphatase PAP2 family protein n=1 Tax=unclassified Methylocystis TaxID=2625913 RepID=UPI0030F51EB4
MILAASALFGLVAPFTSVRIDWESLLPIYVTGTVLAGFGAAYRLRGRDEGIGAALFVAAQLIVYTNVAVLDNYLGLELRRPLNDAFLASLDSAMGVDWWAYVSWVKSNPFVGRLLTLAYLSSLPQVAIAVIVLGFFRRFDRLDRFTIAFMVSSALTIAIWTAFPSFGALPLRYAQGFAEPAFHLAMTRDEALTLLSLHAGPTPTLNLDGLTGLIGCPSFHTSLAILSVYALWGTPYIGPVAAVWNMIVLASVPADGGHHFVDIAAGVIVTFTSLALADAALRRASKAPAPRFTTLRLVRHGQHSGDRCAQEKAGTGG